MHDGAFGRTAPSGVTSSWRSHASLSGNDNFLAPPGGVDTLPLPVPTGVSGPSVVATASGLHTLGFPVGVPPCIVRVVRFNSTAVLQDGIAAGVCSCALVLKWRFETPRRSIQVFGLDALKQCLGFALLRGLSLVFDALFLPDAFRGEYALAGSLADVTLGLLLSWQLLRATEQAMGYSSGRYSKREKDPSWQVSPDCNEWIRQLSAWCAILCLERVVINTFVKFSSNIFVLGNSAETVVVAATDEDCHQLPRWQDKRSFCLFVCISAFQVVITDSVLRHTGTTLVKSETGSSPISSAEDSVSPAAPVPEGVASTFGFKRDVEAEGTASVSVDPTWSVESTVVPIASGATGDGDDDTCEGSTAIGIANGGSSGAFFTSSSYDQATVESPFASAASAAPTAETSLQLRFAAAQAAVKATLAASSGGGSVFGRGGVVDRIRLQASVGDAPRSRPPGDTAPSRFIGPCGHRHAGSSRRAQWEAWGRLRGVSQEDATRQYCDLADEVASAPLEDSYEAESSSPTHAADEEEIACESFATPECSDAEEEAQTRSLSHAGGCLQQVDAGAATASTAALAAAAGTDAVATPQRAGVVRFLSQASKWVRREPQRPLVPRPSDLAQREALEEAGDTEAPRGTVASSASAATPLPLPSSQGTLSDEAQSASLRPDVGCSGGHGGDGKWRERGNGDGADGASAADIAAHVGGDASMVVASGEGSSDARPPDPLDVAFREAQVALKEIFEQGTLGNADKLQLYAHFKQATVGDVRGERPSVWDQVGRYKWDFWAALRGVDSATAKREYCAMTDRHVKGWRATPRMNASLSAASAPVKTDVDSCPVFNAAVAAVIEALDAGRLTAEQAEELRACYKQATLGDVLGERPGVWDEGGRRKWDAWATLRGHGRTAARLRYCDIAKRLGLVEGQTSSEDAESDFAFEDIEPEEIVAGGPSSGDGD
eukprot:TRINITY_DN24034_c0_g1_i3.p1 TRINITY_DN24034_c0_g1~~TRINITY_DN24034_c0_g1_i3.p1  ORF type:complete len:948 (-),score=175.35 TRINITY_DN24034_c0_g1_i3:67-2910(-)